MTRQEKETLKYLIKKYKDMSNIAYQYWEKDNEQVNWDMYYDYKTIAEELEEKLLK